MDADTIRHVASLWGLKIQKIRPDINLCGSPERCSFRTAFESEQGMYIVELLFSNSLHRKQKIAKNLKTLEQRGQKAVHPYLGPEFTKVYKNQHWQVRPYVDGVDLPRSKYADHSWRGKALANWLIDLKKNSANFKGDLLDLPGYVNELTTSINQTKPLIMVQIKPFIKELQEFMSKYPVLKTHFCHGDYHPVNVIWGENKINTVIDWEFSGPKSELYDASILIGCVGMEHPDYLNSPLVRDFIQTLKKHDFADQENWNTLPELVIASRFAWLSEWLRKRDTEMQELELVYMKLLLKNRSLLRKQWKIQGGIR